MSLFRLDASIRTEGSVSREVADTAEAAWSQTHPGATVVRRELGLQPVPSDVWPDAVAGSRTEAQHRTPRQVEAVALAGSLADEPLDADAAIITAPLYNYGVPQHLKAWIDLLLTDPRLAASGGRPLAGRPLVLVVVRGGGYGAGTPREGWDHSTPYLLRIFADLWGMDVHLVEAELTLADVNPALAALRDVAAQSRRDAHVSAEEHGRAVAEAVRANAA